MHINRTSLLHPPISCSRRTVVPVISAAAPADVSAERVIYSLVCSRRAETQEIGAWTDTFWVVGVEWFGQSRENSY